jgi:hypothetical protein
MYFESHLLAIKQFAAHIPIFVRHNLFCDYFMSHKQSEVHRTKVIRNRA